LKSTETHQETIFPLTEKNISAISAR